MSLERNRKLQWCRKGLQGVAWAGFPLLRIVTANTLKALDIHVHRINRQAMDVDVHRTELLIPAYSGTKLCWIDTSRICRLDVS